MIAGGEISMLALGKLVWLNEMGKKASEMVAASLSGMVGMDVTMEVASAAIVAVNEILNVVEFGPEDVAVGVYVGFEGEIGGSALCLYRPEDGKAFAGILLAGIEDDHSSSDGKILSDMEESALLELSNVITSGFIDAWADELKLALTQHPPALVHDFVPAIVEQIMTDIAQKSAYTIAFNTRLLVTDMNIGLDILVLPDVTGIERLRSGR
ncbi:MAG: hypothetical protein CW694_03370 [Candidatus Syntrophoarchaeum sp. WYZ-LMO15]|nr:MAG: hypothetical protein CW694_03370 [Candidatus Syntrophoarchaeum sp. WYZ-LMO15]